MANRTDKEAANIHGTNPQNLIEYIIRQKIYDSVYWKQECFGLSAENIIDKAIALRSVGGMFGQPQKPTEFISLALKLLQIQPEKQIILEFIKNDDFKYLRLLGAFYLRLVGRAVEVYQYLEPLLNDYRKVRVRDVSGSFQLGHIDELIDKMLRSDYLFDVALPRLPTRQMLEKIGQLDPRVSVLEEEFRDLVAKEEAERAAAEIEIERRKQEEHRKETARRDRVNEGDDGRREKWKLDKDDRAKKSRGRQNRSQSRSRSRDRDDYRRRRYRSRSRDRYKSNRDRDEFYDRRRRRSRSRSDDDRERGVSKKHRGQFDGGDREEGEVGGGSKEGMSIEETNKLRAKLGLAPLK